MLAPAASRAERQKLFLLAIACTAPLGFAVLILLLYVGGGSPDAAQNILGISVGLSEIGIVAGQVAALFFARHAIARDRIYGPGLTRAKKVLTFFSALAVTGSVALIVTESFTGFGVGSLGAFIPLVIGAFGFIARIRLRTIERFLAHGHGGPGYAPPGPPYQPW